jgi:hypothetical protein
MVIAVNRSPIAGIYSKRPQRLPVCVLCLRSPFTRSYYEGQSNSLPNIMRIRWRTFALLSAFNVSGTVYSAPVHKTIGSPQIAPLERSAFHLPEDSGQPTFAVALPAPQTHHKRGIHAINIEAIKRKPDDQYSGFGQKQEYYQRSATQIRDHEDSAMGRTLESSTSNPTCKQLFSVAVLLSDGVLSSP